MQRAAGALPLVGSPARNVASPVHPTPHAATHPPALPSALPCPPPALLAPHAVKGAIDGQHPLEQLCLRTRRSDQGSLTPDTATCSVVASVAFGELATRELQQSVLWAQRPTAHPDAGVCFL